MAILKETPDETKALYDQIFEILSDRRRSASFLRYQGVKNTDLIINKLKKGLDKLKVEEDEKQKAMIANAEADQETASVIIAKYGSIESYLAYINPSLKSKLPENAGKKPKRKPKYEYIVNGERKTWTGQGRTPAAIQKLLDSKEAVMEDFLIAEGEN